MTEVRIQINELHMDAIEDIFFAEVDEKEYKKIRPLLLDVWKKLCYAMGDDVECRAVREKNGNE